MLEKANCKTLNKAVMHSLIASGDGITKELLLAMLVRFKTDFFGELFGDILL